MSFKFFNVDRLVADYLEFATEEDYEVVLGEELIEALMMFGGLSQKQAEKISQLAISDFKS